MYVSLMVITELNPIVGTENTKRRESKHITTGKSSDHKGRGEERRKEL